MSPQLVRRMFNQNWFVSSQMKEIRRLTPVFESEKALQILHGLENAAAKFIRSISHKSTLCVIILCLVLGLNCVSYVNCDLEPQPENDDFNSGSDDFLPANNERKDVAGLSEDKVDDERNDYDKFVPAFAASLSVILVSELGDKTFFIAAIMAMQHPRLVVFSGAITALALMTVLSAIFGQLVSLIPRIYTFYISTALFAIFGLKMLRDGYYMSPTDAQEELEKVQSDLKKRDDEFEKETTTTASPPIAKPDGNNVDDDPKPIDENSTMVPPSTHKPKSRSRMSMMIHVLIQAFTMTFLGEWGDRSQVTTIILAARDDVYGVIVGSFLGHAICTGLAVIGGRLVAQRISVQTVTIVGGMVFIFFAISAFFFGPMDDDEPSAKYPFE